MRNRWIVGVPAAGLAAALALTALAQTGRSPGAAADENAGGPLPANTLAAHPGNLAAPGVGGATIAGGGPNQVTANYGAIGGGSANTASGSFAAVGGGVENQASGSRSVIGGGRANRAGGAASTVSGGYTNSAAGDYSTVSGGWRNQSTGYVATIGGGWENIATGQVAVIGGGQYNTALAAAATVSGGWRNRAEGAGAMIPGGRDNIALGEYSLAAGRNANAQHAGTFIWSDATEVGFSSTDINQFLIQAAGNVGIDTDRPHEKLTVAGNIAPAADGTYHLGTETTRWERIYLSQAVEYPDVFAAISGGATNLQLDQSGNLQVAGTMTATRFIGDGSQLTGIQSGGTAPIAPGSITIDKLDLAGLDQRYVRIGQQPSTTNAAVAPPPAVTPPPASDAVTVDANGNVGLGTTTPQAQLHVAGQILIEGGEPGAGKVLTSDASGLATWQAPPAAVATGGEFGGEGSSATRVMQNEQSPNLISGHPSNTVGEATIGATVSGGGRVGKANRADGNFTTVGGGMGNEISGPYSTIGGGFGNTIFNSGSTIGGGIGNTVSNWNVTVSGGRDNSATGLGATIGGGRGNVATNRYATIAGGYFNTAAGPGAAVGGGFANIADGFIATIPGGSQNEANGEYSLAAGRRAKALHSGAFVWGDSRDEDIASTTSNQVVFRAGGGVGINTTDTPEALNVAGNILARGLAFRTNFVISADGEPLVQVDDQGNLQVSGTIQAAGYEGAAMPLASTGATTQSDFTLGANTVGSDEIRDGAVQLEDLNLEALDGRYAKAGEASSAPVVAPPPALKPDSVSSTELVDGTVELEDLNLEALDARYLQPEALAQAITNVPLRDRSVKLQHLDTDSIDARYARLEDIPTSEPERLTLDALDARYITPSNLAAAAAGALAKTAAFGGMASGTYSNLALREGAVELRHLDLESLDARYAKADETSAVPAAVDAAITPGSINLEDLNLDSIDQHYITQSNLAASAAGALAKTAAFGGMASGTYSNLALREGAVELRHLDLESLDARYAKAGETSAVPAAAITPGSLDLDHLNVDALDQRYITQSELSAAAANALAKTSPFGGMASGTYSNLALREGAVELRHLDLESLDARYAKAGETSAVPAAAITPGSIDLDHLNVDALDQRYITQSELSAAAANALAKTSPFGGVVSGTYSNLSINPNTIGSPQVQDGSIGIADLKIDELDARYAPAGAVATTNTAPALPHIIAPNQVSGIALTQDTLFTGDVAGPFSNLVIAADSIGLDKIDTDSLDERYATAEDVADLATHSHPLPPMITSNGLAAGSVQSAAIADGTISLRDLDLASIDERYPTLEVMNRKLDEKLAAGNTPPEVVQAAPALEDGSITGTHIRDGSITSDDLELESLDARYVKREGDTLSGPLTLPPGGLTVGDSELVVRDGRIGVGVEQPTVSLDVGGAIRIAGGEPGEGKLLVSDHDGRARWAAPGELSLGSEAADPEDVRYGSVFGPRVQQPLNLQVAGQRALRIEPTAVSPNIVGGSNNNTVKPRSVGATIAGGGHPDQPNRIDADFGGIGGGAGHRIEGAYGTIGGGWENLAEGARSTISGGRLNAARGAASTVGGGFTNMASGSYATIGGGYANTAEGYVSTIAGGWGNTATGTVATIGGGQDNTATGSGATVSGGWKNRADGLGAIVPGGKANVAQGEFSAALGLRSQALHDGAFVWSDSEDAAFSSTANDQFLIKARGNVGIDDNNPSEKLTIKGNIAPTTHRRFNLGSPTARWETLYLGSTLDIANPLRITREGKPVLAVSPDGDLNVTGSIIGSRFMGDGSGLTNLPARDIADGSIGLQHLSEEIRRELTRAAETPTATGERPISPARIEGIAVTQADRFDGHVTGTYQQLKLRDGVIEQHHLSTDLAASLRRPTPAATTADSLAVTGTVTAARFVGDGSALTGIKPPQLQPATIADVHVRPDAAISPAKVNGIALTRGDTFGGDVRGPFNELTLRDGAVSMQHLGSDVTEALNKPAPQATDLDPAAIKGVALTQANQFGGAVSGTYNTLALRDGAVSMQHLGSDVTEALNKPAPEVTNLDPAAIKGTAVTHEDRVDGVLAGTLSNLQYRANSITGPAVADGAISLRHIDRAVLQELTPEPPDLTRVPELTVHGPLRATRLSGDGSGLTNIPFSAVTVPTDSVNADMLAPESVFVENLAPGLAALIQRELPDLDRLTDLTLRGTLSARRLAGDGAAITGLQFSALEIPADSIGGDLIKPGSIGKEHLAPELAEMGAAGWLLGGNRTGGSRPATVGTMNEAPLHVVAGGRPVLRLRPGATSPSVVGGHGSNLIEPGAEGSVIAGGGAAGSPNRIAQRYSTIGGGINNQAANEFVTVGGGSGNIATGFDATISGGQDNQAAGSGSMIGGGFTNVAAGSFSAILGGAANRADGNVATVAGGYGNSASGSHATVPGGSLNKASADYTLAAGRRAVARHPGSFVWSDGTDHETATTAPNQFVAQASGGMRLISDPSGRAGVHLQPGSGSWSTLSDRTLKENFVPVNVQRVLDAVVSLPLTTWNYKTQEPAIRHLGPTAQDFHAAFDLGTGDTHITGVDAQGVALAAIQGMHQLLREKDAQIHALQQENLSLAERIERIELQLSNTEPSEIP